MFFEIMVLFLQRVGAGAHSRCPDGSIQCARQSGDGCGNAAGGVTIRDLDRRIKK